MSLPHGIVAVLGGGAGGQILAGIAAQNGHDVRLFSAQAASPEWEQFAVERTVRWSGPVAGRAELRMVSDRLDQVVDGASIVVVSAPATRHSHYIRELATRSAGVPIVIFVPGNYAAQRLLHAISCGGVVQPAPPLIAETNTLPFSARVTTPGTVMIHRHKRTLLVGAATTANASRAADVLGDVFGYAPDVDWKTTGSLLEVALANVNAILHVPLMLLNAGSLSRRRAGFQLLPDGLSPAADRLIALLDAERLAVATAFGITVPPIVETFTAAGFDPGATISDVLATVSISESQADRFPDRRLAEEVPFALWPLIALAERVGVVCPALRATAQFADLLLDTSGPGFPVGELFD